MKTDSMVQGAKGASEARPDAREQLARYLEQQSFWRRTFDKVMKVLELAGLALIAGCLAWAIYVSINWSVPREIAVIWFTFPGSIAILLILVGVHAAGLRAFPPLGLLSSMQELVTVSKAVAMGVGFASVLLVVAAELGPAEAYIRQMRELASSGRSAEELFARVADMTMEVPGLDDPVRMGDVRGEGYLRLYAECLSQLEPEVLDLILAGRLTYGWDLEALLRQVSCPALLVQGEPALGGLEDQPAERAVALLPRGQRIKIPGAGHNIHQTQPEALLQVAVQFLRST